MPGPPIRCRQRRISFFRCHWLWKWHKRRSRAASRRGYNVAVSIVDRTGVPQLLLAGDGASVTSRDLARRKAYTSALRRGTTIELAKSVAAGGFNPTLYDTQMVIAGGGLPIKAGNETIGGIGVSGAPGGDKDEACASAGLDKIKDRLI